MVGLGRPSLGTRMRDSRAANTVGIWFFDEHGVTGLAGVVVRDILPDHAEEVVTTASLARGGSGTCTTFATSVHFSSPRSQSLVHHDVRPRLHVVVTTSKLHRELRDDIPPLYTFVLSAPKLNKVVAPSDGGRCHMISNPKGAEAVPPEDVLVIEYLGVGSRNGLIRSWTPWLESRVENPQPRPSFGDEDLSTVCVVGKFDH